MHPRAVYVFLRRIERFFSRFSTPCFEMNCDRSSPFNEREDEPTMEFEDFVKETRRPEAKSKMVLAAAIQGSAGPAYRGKSQIESESQ